VTVKIEKVGNRIHLVAPYRVARLQEDIPGSSYSDKRYPRWSIPLSMVNCRLLRGKFGSKLHIGPELTAWARAEVDRERSMAELGSAADAELVRVQKIAPKLADAMSNRTFQRVAAKFLATSRAALIADDPGLGKTLEAMAGVVESGVRGPYLVVCPKTAVESVWVPEIKRWLGIDAISVPDGKAKRDSILNGLVAITNNPGTGKPGGSHLDDTWVVVHPEMVRTKSWWECRECEERTPVWAGPKNLICEHNPKQAPRIDEHVFPQLFNLVWGAVLFDESHNALIRKTGKNTQARNGAEMLGLRADSLKAALSGTPFRGKKHLLWGTLNWLRPKEYSGATRWTNTYFEIQVGFGGSRNIGPMREDRKIELYRELDKIMLRRTKAEVAPDMPEKTYAGTPLLPSEELSPVGVWLPMLPAQEAAYRQMLKSSVASIEGGDLNAIGILAEMTRLKQFATSSGALVGNSFAPRLPSNKFDWILEHLHEIGMGDPDGQPSTRVVVVSQFTSVLNMFRTELARNGIASCSLTGEVTGVARSKVISAFNTPGEGPDVMLLNVKAGGVAITIDTADEMVFLDETFVDDEQKQAEDRIHRLSKPRPVVYYYLRSKGSIEESIALSNYQQKISGHEILDGRRGIEFAREVLGI